MNSWHELFPARAFPVFEERMEEAVIQKQQKEEEQQRAEQQEIENRSMMGKARRL